MINRVHNHSTFEEYLFAAIFSYIFLCIIPALVISHLIDYDVGLGWFLGGSSGLVCRTLQVIYEYTQGFDDVSY